MMVTLTSQYNIVSSPLPATLFPTRVHGRDGMLYKYRGHTLNYHLTADGQIEG